MNLKTEDMTTISIDEQKIDDLLDLLLFDYISFYEKIQCQALVLG
jgi:hypothetical protein